jgi:hypothetical protein
MNKQLIKRKNNIKFVIFLSECNMRKKSLVCGKRYTERLRNKGIYAIDYNNWKKYFIDNSILMPTFDINETSPTMGVVYKRFTENKYLSLENYDNYLFREQCRSLSTLVSYLGASSITVEQLTKDEKRVSVGAGVSVASEVKIDGKFEKENNINDNRLGVKDFDINVESFILYGGKKFDKCASEGGLYGVDKDIYKRLYFVNIVSERFNGQQKSFFTIQKKINSNEILDISLYINKLNIGLNLNYDNTKNYEETYTFIIKYHDLNQVLKQAKENLIVQKKKEKKEKTEIDHRELKHSKYNISDISDTISQDKEHIINDDTNLDTEGSGRVLTLEYDSDSESKDIYDIELEEIIDMYKKDKDNTKYKKSIMALIDTYSEYLGIKKQFEMWKEHDNNTTIFNCRVRWIKYVCDLDYFFRSIGLL